jgi:hypothetical protein
MRFVAEKHNELIASLNDLVNALVSENIEAKKSKANISLTKANDLKSSISQQDYPAWLPPLIQGLEYFSNNQWKAHDLIAHLIGNITQIKSHKWVFENPSESAFDFDSIFEHYKSQSRLSELFDEIIKILEQIQDSGEIDSVAMMAALGKVIATLKQNKEGSYFSINSAWSFLVSFLENYMWAELSKLPVLGTAMEALEKTIQETNEEMHKVHSEIQSEMKNLVEAEVKGLQKKTEFQFIGYDKAGVNLPRIESNSMIDENV